MSRDAGGIERRYLRAVVVMEVLWSVGIAVLETGSDVCCGDSRCDMASREGMGRLWKI